MREQRRIARAPRLQVRAPLRLRTLQCLVEDLLDLYPARAVNRHVRGGTTTESITETPEISADTGENSLKKTHTIHGKTPQKRQKKKTKKNERRLAQRAVAATPPLQCLRPPSANSVIESCCCRPVIEGCGSLRCQSSRGSARPRARRARPASRAGSSTRRRRAPGPFPPGRALRRNGTPPSPPAAARCAPGPPARRPAPARPPTSTASRPAHRQTSRTRTRLRASAPSAAAPPPPAPAASHAPRSA